MSVTALDTQSQELSGMNKRTAPVLALVTVYFLLVGVFAAGLTQSKYFTEILAFAAPLIGVILAFYFTVRTSQPA